MHQRTRLATIQTQFPIAMNNIVNHANGINAIKQPMFMTESLSYTEQSKKDAQSTACSSNVARYINQNENRWHTYDGNAVEE